MNALRMKQRSGNSKQIRAAERNRSQRSRIRHGGARSEQPNTNRPSFIMRGETLQNAGALPDHLQHLLRNPVMASPVRASRIVVRRATAGLHWRSRVEFVLPELRASALDRAKYGSNHARCCSSRTTTCAIEHGVAKHAATVASGGSASAGRARFAATVRELMPQDRNVKTSPENQACKAQPEEKAQPGERVERRATAERACDPAGHPGQRARIALS